MTAASHDLVAAGDVTGDGLVDVVGHTPGAVSVYAQQEDSSFAPSAVVSFPASTSAFTVVDANSDGRLDIVATADGSTGAAPAMFVVPQLMDGTLGRPNAHPSLAAPQGLIAADVTGDRLDDVVTAHGGIGRIGFYPQLSAHDGYFDQHAVEVPTTAAYDARSLAAGRLDGKASVDVAVAAGERGLLILRGAAS